MPTFLYHYTKMISARQKAIELISENGGLIRTHEALKMGIHRRTLYGLWEDGSMIQLTRGLYQLADVDRPRDAYLAEISIKAPKAVICLRSALMLHDLSNHAPAVVWLAVAAAGVAVMGGLWGMGVMYRSKRQSAGGLVQIGLFVALFLSIGTMPLDLMEGWLPRVARRNPITPILTLARAGFVGTNDWQDIWPGLIAIAGSSVLLAWWALRGMRGLTP